MTESRVRTSEPRPGEDGSARYGPPPAPGQQRRPGRQEVLEVVPVSFRQVRDFICLHHRHHRPPQGMKFALGATSDGVLAGVAVVGRPLARHLDVGRTAEVTRTCTDGTANVNSQLYAAAWRAAGAVGYRRLVTYTEDGESGASLRAAGFTRTARIRPHSGWDRPGRHRHTSPPVGRSRWEIWRAPSIKRRSADRTPPARGEARRGF